MNLEWKKWEESTCSVILATFLISKIRGENLPKISWSHFEASNDNFCGPKLTRDHDIIFYTPSSFQQH